MVSGAAFFGAWAMSKFYPPPSFSGCGRAGPLATSGARRALPDLAQEQWNGYPAAGCVGPCMSLAGEEDWGTQFAAVRGSEWVGRGLGPGIRVGRWSRLSPVFACGPRGGAARPESVRVSRTALAQVMRGCSPR
jgi:hypothetical protein